MVKRIKPGIMCWFSYKGKGKAVFTDAMNEYRRSLGVIALIRCGGGGGGGVGGQKKPGE